MSVTVAIKFCSIVLAGATFTEPVAATHSHPYVIRTRVDATEAGKVSKMVSVVTAEGDWVFGAAEYLAVTQYENSDVIPEADRDTREVIKASADTYPDNWGGSGVPCAAWHALRPARGPHEHGQPGPCGQYLRHGDVPADCVRVIVEQRPQ